jgi:hypothetical protein
VRALIPVFFIRTLCPVATAPGSDNYYSVATAPGADQ